jgi:hypothetical protein
LHGDGQVLLREGLSDHGEAVASALATGELEDLQLWADIPRALGQFVPVHAGHVDIGNQYRYPLISPQLIESF